VAMRRSDKQVLTVIRMAMARLGQPVDDLTDDQLRARAVRLVGDRPNALEVILRALRMRDDIELSRRVTVGRLAAGGASSFPAKQPAPEDVHEVESARKASSTR
jgi:hypothetical protein